jgi:hypothetical protein
MKTLLYIASQNIKNKKHKMLFSFPFARLSCAESACVWFTAQSKLRKMLAALQRRTAHVALRLRFGAVAQTRYQPPPPLVPPTTSVLF